MKIGRIHHHLKARFHARLNHVSVLLSLAKISLAPNRTLEHCGQVRQGPMVDPYNRLEGAKGLPCCQTEDERNHPNGRFLCPISEWSTGHSIGNVTELAIAKWPPTGWRHCASRAVCFYSNFDRDLGDWSNEFGAARVAGKHRPSAAATSKRCAICGKRAARHIPAHRRSKWLRPHRN
jgi:hypothetical protein